MKLGSGSFGVVWLVEHKETGRQYALKVLDKKLVIVKNLVRYAMSEKNVLAQMRHPFIVSFKCAF